MKERKIKVTLYLTLELWNKETQSFLQKIYTECSFSISVPNASINADPADLVPDRVISERLNDMLNQQEKTILPSLKTKYPDLPDFYIGHAELFTKQALFAGNAM